MGEKGRMAPAVRFPGFVGDWEQRKLGEVADIVGGGTPSTAISDYWDGDIDWYAPAEIADQIYVHSSQKKITTQGYNNSSAKMLPVGTVLFTSRAGIGKTAILAHEGCTNQGFQSIVPHKEALDSYFIFSRTEELKEYGETTGAGSTFVEVSGRQMAAMELMMPPTMDEQQKIGAYFRSLDRLITHTQRECDGYRRAKKAVAQKLFSRKVRFKKGGGEEFPEWEERKLGECCESLKTQTLKEEDLKPNGEFLVVNGGRGFYGRYNEANNKGDCITVSARGEAGHVKYMAEPFWAGGLCYAYRATTCCTRYIAEYMMFYESKLQNMFVQKNSIPAVNKSDLNTFLILMPSDLEEQRLIAGCLSAYDHLVSAAEKEMEGYRRLKKAMLQKMFV